MVLGRAGHLPLGRLGIAHRDVTEAPRAVGVPPSLERDTNAETLIDN